MHSVLGICRICHIPFDSCTRTTKYICGNWISDSYTSFNSAPSLPLLSPLLPLPPHTEAVYPFLSLRSRPKHRQQQLAVLSPMSRAYGSSRQRAKKPPHCILFRNLRAQCIESTCISHVHRLLACTYIVHARHIIFESAHMTWKPPTSVHMGEGGRAGDRGSNHIVCRGKQKTPKFSDTEMLSNYNFHLWNKRVKIQNNLPSCMSYTHTPTHTFTLVYMHEI